MRHDFVHDFCDLIWGYKQNENFCYLMSDVIIWRYRVSPDLATESWLLLVFLALCSPLSVWTTLKCHVEPCTRMYSSGNHFINRRVRWQQWIGFFFPSNYRLLASRNGSRIAPLVHKGSYIRLLLAVDPSCSVENVHTLRHSAHTPNACWSWSVSLGQCSTPRFQTPAPAVPVGNHPENMHWILQSTACIMYHMTSLWIIKNKTQRNVLHIMPDPSSETVLYVQDK